MDTFWDFVYELEKICTGKSAFTTIIAIIKHAILSYIVLFLIHPLLEIKFIPYCFGKKIQIVIYLKINVNYVAIGRIPEM